MKIGLVACCSSKLETSSKVPAQSLYVSPLFTFSKAYCEKYLDGWFILSAKFGLVSPTELLPMYEESLIGKREREKKVWAYNAWKQLEAKLGKGDEIVWLAGKEYSKYIAVALQNAKIKQSDPLEGLGIGYRMQFLKNSI